MYSRISLTTLAMFVMFSSTANEWVDIHPENPGLALGGPVEYYGFSPFLIQQFMLSVTGVSYRRDSSFDSWTEYSPLLTNGLRVYPKNMLFDPANPLVITANSGSSFNSSVISSADGGYTWERIYFGVLEGPGIELAGAAPSNANILYGWASQTKEIARSTDRGDTWSLTASPDMLNLRSLIIHPANPDVLYALDTQRIKKSTDAGATWTVMEEGTGTYWYMNRLIMDPLDPDVMYAISGALPRVYKTISGGQFWFLLNSTPTDLDRTMSHLVVNFVPDGILYGATRSGRLVKSLTGGATWEAFPASRTFSQWSYLIQTSTGELTAAGPVGVATATAVGVEESNAGFSQFRIWDVQCAGADCAYQYAASNESGLIYNTPATQDWQVARGDFNSEVYSVTVNPQDPENVFLSTDGGLWESENAGGSWTELFSMGGPTIDLVISSTNPDLMFVLAFSGVYKTEDGGSTWVESLGSGVINQCCGSTPLLISPADNDFLVMGTPNSGIYRSTDGGVTWQVQDDVFAGTQGVSDLRMNPNNPDQLILVQSLGEGLWRSDNFGETWYPMTQQGITSSLFASSVLFDPYVDGRLFLMTHSDGIIYVYDDQAQLWSPITPEPSEYSFCGFECTFDAVESVQGRFITNLGRRLHVIDIDSDQDGVIESQDNCTLVANSDQRDTDSDGFGNACDPDLNNDLVVNFIDLSLFSQRFLSNDPDADFDGDGVVNFVDFDVFTNYFNKAPGPAAR